MTPDWIENHKRSNQGKREFIKFNNNSKSEQLANFYK